MIKKFSLLGLCLLLSMAVKADCDLPRGESLKIGCSYSCNFFYQFRLKLIGWGLGYSLQIKNLANEPDLKEALLSVDAILIPGGADIDPKYYIEQVKPELQEHIQQNLNLVNYSEEGKKRDPFEYELLQTYSNDETYKDLPLLGICRGMQMMSVAQGIPLYLDIKTEVGIKNRENKFDKVFLTKDDSLLNKIYRKKSFRGYEIHHQGLRVPYYLENKAEYPLTRVTAYSNNGHIAEAIEYTHRKALGVQYHPERSFTGTSVPVIKWFLNQACEYKTSSHKENL